MDNPITFKCCDEIKMTPSKYYGRWNGYCGWCAMTYIAVWEKEENTVKYYKFHLKPSDSKEKPKIKVNNSF